MKKSKMIELLAEDLNENYGLDFLADYPETVAKGVIEFLESKGMRPPKEQVTQHLKVFTKTFITETWEPEDD